MLQKPLTATKLIKDFDNDSLHKVKSDKADTVKIARYALDKWQNLKQYSVMDELRSQLKTMNRQFVFYMKHKTAMKNNLIGILDQTYPGVNAYFDSPARSDGSQKWVDYQNWCKRKKYNFSQSRAEEIYGKAKELAPVLPKDDITRLDLLMQIPVLMNPVPMNKKVFQLQSIVLLPSGKPYYVYMTAGANKFLRIYYGQVKEYLASLPES